MALALPVPLTEVLLPASFRPRPGLLTWRSRRGVAHPAAFERLHCRSANLTVPHCAPLSVPPTLTVRVTCFGRCNGGRCDSPIIHHSSQVLSEAHGTDPNLPLRRCGHDDHSEK